MTSAATAIPATMMSERSGFRPATPRRSSSGIAASASRMCSTSTRGTAVACTFRAMSIPRRARWIPARFVNVPPEPMSWAPRQSRRGSTAFNAVRTSMRSFRIAFGSEPSRR